MNKIEFKSKLDVANLANRVYVDYDDIEGQFKVYQKKALSETQDIISELGSVASKMKTLKLQIEQAEDYIKNIQQDYTNDSVNFKSFQNRNKDNLDKGLADKFKYLSKLQNYTKILKSQNFNNKIEDFIKAIHKLPQA